MPLLSIVGKKTLSQRLIVAALYLTLGFFGATMAVPFMIMLTSSASNAFDYDRYSITPRSLWSKEDRFMKGTPYFAGPGALFPDAPVNWTSWRAVGLDKAGVDRLASAYLGADEAEKARWRKQAADYSDFSLGHDLVDTTVTAGNERTAEFMLDRYVRLATDRNPLVAKMSRKDRELAALDLLSERWGAPIKNYIAIRMDRERRYPKTQQSWVPPGTAKWEDFIALAHAVRHGSVTPGVMNDWESFLKSRGFDSAAIKRLSPLPEGATAEEKALWAEFAREHAPLAPVIPLSLRDTWIDYLRGDEVRSRLKLGDGERFDVARYNRLAGTTYARLEDTPFPLPADAAAGLRPLWDNFVMTQYPLRLVSLRVDEGLRERYRAFLTKTYGDIGTLNRLLGENYASWSGVPLAEKMPAGRADNSAGLREVWVPFVKTLSAAERQVGSADASWQAFLRERYASLDAVNAAYGWKLGRWEEARMPLDKAYAVTYANHAASFALEPVVFNYQTIMRFLVDQGNSIPVTLWLIILSIVSSLTVNPLAGYALSRFNLKMKDKIILFCLATSAFPAMVSAIPGYLLMRDLGMLNTFFALVLPGAASGMAIFILKGFFDSLPQELYEAATIDGAKEWQIFIFVTIPMVTPILAINALNAFMAAYDGWAWALIICQDPEMWTISVWLYQASQWWSQSPWITTAGFVVTSIPTLIVFIFCQKIIMRGIIVPSMK